MPPIESRAAATWVSAWVSTPPVTARVSTMVNVIPFLGLRDGTHRCAVGSGNPGLLHRPGRSDRQNRWCHNLGPGRHNGSHNSPTGVSRIGSQAGTQAADATRAPRRSPASRAGSTSYSLPADYADLVVIPMWASDPAHDAACR